MKVREYEKNTLVLFLCFLIFVIEIIFILLIYSNKEYAYDKLTGIVVKEDISLLVITKDTKKILYKNKYLYLNDKKTKFKIIEERDNPITKDNKKYYEVLIKYKFDKKYKTSDTIPISIKTEKYRLIEIFKLIWDGD